MTHCLPLLLALSFASDPTAEKQFSLEEIDAAIEELLAASRDDSAFCDRATGARRKTRRGQNERLASDIRDGLVWAGWKTYPTLRQI